ncbi:UNVERIFIED_CONTAM: Btbd17 [Trichonephila clavipes]
MKLFDHLKFFKNVDFFIYFTSITRLKRVLWLQYTLNCGHSLVYKACASFIAWNFELVSDMEDFGTLETDVLISFLQKSDLVISDEVAVFQ